MGGNQKTGIGEETMQEFEELKEKLKAIKVPEELLNLRVLCSFVLEPSGKVLEQVGGE